MLDFQRLFAAMPELYCVLTLDFVIIEGSNAYFQATKTKREEVVGRCVFDVFPENPNELNAKSAQNLRASLESVVQNRQPHTMSLQKYDIRRPDVEGGGFEERYWKVVNSPVFDETGELTHILNRSEDVTKLVKMQQQRSQFQQEAVAAKQQVDTILSSIRDGFYAFDRDWRFTYVNDRLCEMVGMQRETMLGRTIWELFDDLHDTDVYWQFQRGMNEQTPSCAEYFYPTWNRWYEHRVYPTPDGLAVLATDITDRKQAELMLVEQKQLLEMIASGQPIDECFSALCNAVARLNPGVRACFLLTDEQRSTFSRSITSDVPVSFGEGFQDAPISELAIEPCSKAVYSSQPVTCADIANDSSVGIVQRANLGSKNWRDLCVAHGVLACHSAPVLSADGLPLGALMLAFNEARLPSDWEYQLAKFGTQVASIALERDRAHLAQRQNEEKYRLLFESIDEGCCICEMLFDENGEPQDYRFLEVNPMFEDITGLEQAMGKTARELIPNLDAHWVEIYGRVVQTGEPIRCEKQALTLNRWFDVNAFPIGEPQNHQFGVLVANATERVRVEDERKRVEQERERFLALGSDLQVIKGIDGYFQWVSPAFEHTLGWTLEEMTAQPWTEFVYPEDINASVSEADRVLSGNETARFENRYRHKDGSYRWFLWKARFYPEEQVVYGAAVDITQRKQAEAALREANVQLESALAAGAIYTWRWDILTDRVVVNAPFAHLFAVDPELATTEGLPISLFLNAIHEEDGPRVAAAVQQAIETGETYAAEYRVHTANGEYRWLTARGRVEYDATGSPVSFPGALVDNTVAKLLEEDRKQSEERYRTLFESIEDGFCIIEMLFDETNAPIDYRFLEINPAFKQQTGLEQAVGKRMLELAPQHEKHWFEIYGKVALTGESIRFENYAAALHRWYDVYACRIGQPKSCKVAVLFKDISERKQIEATVQVRNERLKLISTIANDLLLNENPKAFLASLFAQISTHLGLEVYLNYLFEGDQQHLQLYTYGGISDEIAKSATVLELGQGACGDAVQHRQPAVVEDALESDHALALPLRSIGLRAYASHPLVVGDRVLGTLGLGTRQRDRFTHDELDLMQTVANQVAAALERSRLVAELEARAEALTQTNRIKDEFLAVLSHELRSPLNPILGWTRLLQQGKLDPIRQVEALKTIERNAKLQSQLIEDLLDISRIMQGKLSFTAAPVNLTFVISAAIETVRLAAEAKQIQILLDLDPAIASVSGDAGRLQQVVWNLLTNAVKFTPNGGQVMVELRQVDHLAQIRVIDTGRGINPQFLPHVFEYFRQEDGSTTRKFGGLGLGLAIVRQIVELHGGTVQVESLGEGLGATFTVTLPLMLIPSPVKPDQAPSEASLNLNGVKILVIDDEIDSREFVAFVLEQAGATVITAPTAGEGFLALTHSQSDVLLSDIGMPEMDGYMLMQQVRALPPEQGGQVRAIALTAYAGEYDQRHALQAGFQHHVSKPVDPEVLVQAIIHLLEPA